MTEESTLSKSMKVVLNGKFPQFQLLSTEEFLYYLKKRGIKRDISDLEYYDKTNVIKPILRLGGSLHDNSFKRCSKNQTFNTLQIYLENDLIIFPHDDDFQPWSKWLDKFDEPVCMYYHPAQIVGFEHLTNIISLNLNPQRFLEIKDPQKYVSNVQKNYLEKLERIQKVVKDSWVPRIGFLILLEEAYSVDVKQEYFGISHEEKSFEKWQKWRSDEFSTQTIIDNSQIDKDKIFELHHHLARINYDDPLGNWFPLQQILKKSRKRQLTGLGLISQDYYEFAEMVSNFIEDHFKEKTVAPDCLGGDWHARIFGEPFDYDSKKTQKAILDYYLFYPPIKVAILFEGSTENYVIKKIIESLNIFMPKSGLSLHNLEGADNLQSNFDSFFKLAKKQKIDGFVILDQDKKNMVEELVRRGSINDDMYVVWENDFEFDNFGIEKVVEIVNVFLEGKKAKTIVLKHVKNRLENGDVMLMAAISEEVKKENGGIKLTDFVSKTQIAQTIFDKRAIEIQDEYENNKWTPKLPIEKKLQQLFRKFPSYL